MRRLGKTLFGAIAATIIGGTILCAGNTCQAAEDNLTVGEVYNTAVETAYGDTFRSVYENRLAGSPLEVEEIDGVDTATGHLMLSRNDLLLDGTGGMDFEHLGQLHSGRWFAEAYHSKCGRLEKPQKSPEKPVSHI